MKLSKIFATLGMFFMTFNAFAQISSTEMTEYEIEREKLSTTALEKITNAMSRNDQMSFGFALVGYLDSAQGDRFQETILVENLVLAFCELGDVFKTESYYYSHSLSMRNAYIGHSLQEFKQIGEWYKAERIKLEKKKTNNDIIREKQREELRNELLGLPGIFKNIKIDYLKWATKGEFEKTTEYNKRISEEGSIFFDDLCFKYINVFINNKMKMTIPGNRYDADRDGCPVKFYYENIDGSEKAAVESFWSITPQQYKNRGNSRDVNNSIAKGIFIKNNCVFPSIYSMIINTEKWDISIGAPEKVNISMKEVLGDSFQPNWTDHSFEYSKYLNDKEMREREAARKAAAAKAKEIETAEYKGIAKYNINIIESILGSSDYVNDNKQKWEDDILDLLCRGKREEINVYVITAIKSRVSILSKMLNEDEIKKYKSCGYCEIVSSIKDILSKNSWNQENNRLYVESDDIYGTIISSNEYLSKKYGNLEPQKAWEKFTKPKFMNF